MNVFTINNTAADFKRLTDICGEIADILHNLDEAGVDDFPYEPMRDAECYAFSFLSGYAGLEETISNMEFVKQEIYNDFEAGIFKKENN